MTVESESRRIAYPCAGNDRFSIPPNHLFAIKNQNTEEIITYRTESDPDFPSEKSDSHTYCPLCLAGFSGKTSIYAPRQSYDPVQDIRPAFDPQIERIAQSDIYAFEEFLTQRLISLINSFRNPNQ